ncbi:VapC toxin family PIN domain ribonuclease [Pseudonocardia sp. TMWB2A]|uniref:type II toxin-antitoxin system VapC family toxin n=1 Tax=Pseudonocardia sp. TMWB2A TaxID=687430 RepID=UPI00307CC906
MKYLLDANIIIYALTGTGDRLRYNLARCSEGDLAISAIAFAEVAKGIGLGKPPPLAALDAFMEEVTLLPFDAAAAQAYARLPFRRGSFDRLIAAHALATGLTLVTSNEVDFADIPGLKVENWMV